MFLPKNLREEYVVVTSQPAVTFLDFSQTCPHQLKQYIAWPTSPPKVGIMSLDRVNPKDFTKSVSITELKAINSM